MAGDKKHAEDLYALPREEFMGARQALAKKLKAEGDGKGAAEVGGLKKPTVAAWAVNQLARTRREEIEDLVRVGREIGKLQRKGSAKGGPDELREASRARRSQVDSLVGAAEKLLGSAGYGIARTHLDGVAATLEAAVRDEEARDLVLRGVLDKELPPPVGFGDLGGLRPVPDSDQGDFPEEAASTAATESAKPARGRKGAAPAKPGRKVAATPPRETAADIKARERRARAREHAGRLSSQADELEADAHRLRQEAAGAERVAMKARDAADRAERKAAQARERSDQAWKSASG